MTTQKSFKSRVRTRAAKTGERYAAARRELIAKADRLTPAVSPAAPLAAPAAPPDAPPFKPAVSDDVLRKATGRTWDEWFALLDAWDATSHKHPEIARWLNGEHGVDGWWAQNVTVGYERARGLRVVHQRPSGFEVSASKTVRGSTRQLYDAFADPALRERWLPDGKLTPRPRTMHPGKGARFDWDDGASAVVVGFTDKPGGKAQVALAHQDLPDAETAEAMKVYWRSAMPRLAKLIQS